MAQTQAYISVRTRKNESLLVVLVLSLACQGRFHGEIGIAVEPSVDLNLGGRLREVAVYENLDYIFVILGQSFALLAYVYCRVLAHVLNVSIVGKVNFAKKNPLLPMELFPLLYFPGVR